MDLEIIILWVKEAGKQSLEGDTWQRISAVRASLTRRLPTCDDKFIMTLREKRSLLRYIGAKAVDKINPAIFLNEQSNRYEQSGRNQIKKSPGP